jgi:hypothetical protein
MTDLTGRYEGRDVVIDFDTMEVKVRRVSGWWKWRQEEWLDVPLTSLAINTYWPSKLDTTFGKFSIADLPLTLEEISRGLGVIRLDTQCAVRIWKDSRSVKGDNVAIDFLSRELVLFHSTGPRSRPTIVIPFSAVAGIVDSESPRILIKNVTFGQEWEIRGLPITAKTLAEKLDVELIR